MDGHALAGQTKQEQNQFDDFNFGCSNGQA